MILAITLFLLAWFTGPLCPDVSGQFWNAHAMRRGARLYVDIVEINPPLWFWMAMPVDRLAELLGVRTQPVTIMVIAATVLGAVYAVGRLLPDASSRARAAFLAYVAAILLIMPARQLEQREHLVLIGAVPYLVLAAARRQQRDVRPMLALLIGVGAGLGFALKPYFLAVPASVELWLIVALRRAWRPGRPEIAALCMTGAAYAAAVLIFTPQYLSSAIPLLLTAYNGFGATFMQTIGLLPLIWLCILLGIIEQWRASRWPPAPLTTALLIGAGGFALAWALQHKGWLYQGLPASGCGALALAAILFETGPSASRLVRLFAPALLVWPLSFAIVDTETTITPNNDIAPALAELQAGDAFGLVSTAGATTWPSTVDRDLRLSSRYGQYWMLRALDQRPNDPAIRALAQRAVEETALDYRCLPPKVIIFVRLDRSPSNTEITTDPYRFFAHDPSFAAVLGRYRLWRIGPAYDAYRQALPLDPIDASLCRRPG
ncbi:MAG: hypothetical protein ABR588_10640 [Sphingomicrobium sp.]